MSPLPASASRAGLSLGLRPNNPKEAAVVGDVDMRTLAGAATTGRRDAPTGPTTTRRRPRCSAGTRAATDRSGRRSPRPAATSTKRPTRRGGWAVPPGKTPERAHAGSWWPAGEARNRRTGLDPHRKHTPGCKSPSHQERGRWWLEMVQPGRGLGSGAAAAPNGAAAGGSAEEPWIWRGGWT